jgi:hypothetical protein
MCRTAMSIGVSVYWNCRQADVDNAGQIKSENLSCQSLQFCNDWRNLQVDSRGSEASAVNEVDRPQLVVEAGCGCPSARHPEILHWSKILQAPSF